jgi:hypothetical protein
VWLHLLLAGSLARQLHKPLLAAAGIGVSLGLATYLAGVVVAATLNGLVGFAGSLLVSAWVVLQRLTRIRAAQSA